MASSPRAEVFHIPTFLLGEMKGLCSRGEWRASRRKTVSRKDCGPSSLRRSIFVFPQLILRNRKRLLRVYDTLKPAVSVLNVRRSKIRDFCRDSPSNPTATVSMPRKFREIKTKYQHCDQTSANCQLHPQHQRVVQKQWGLQVSCKVK